MEQLTEKALRLKQLLKVLSATDTENETALQEMPGALTIAAELSEQMYCAIVDGEREDK